MRIRSCTIYALEIPFVEAFAHHAKRRRASDSIVVRLETSDGAAGYGEGLARAYVTGETVESSIAHIRERLWPAVRRNDYADLKAASDPLFSLAHVQDSLPFEGRYPVTAFNAARSAIEIALVDALLRRQNLSLSELLPPRRTSLTYSGVISSGSIEGSLRRAKQLRLFGLRDVKIKIKSIGDVERIAAVRELMGESARLRVDANGAFDTRGALEMARRLSPLHIDAFEQPVSRGDGASALREVREGSKIPIMADESLVTAQDAQGLVEAGAVDYFNLRLSKCGGITGTLRLAQMAREAGVRLQLGSQVGETAILSAAGRHVAAYLDDAEFLEGSYGTLLLAEDVSRDPVQFGHGGRAAMLRGPGLGVQVREDVLRKYARETIKLGGGGHD